MFVINFHIWKGSCVTVEHDSPSDRESPTTFRVVLRLMMKYHRFGQVFPISNMTPNNPADPLCRKYSMLKVLIPPLKFPPLSSAPERAFFLPTQEGLSQWHAVSWLLFRGSEEPSWLKKP